MYYVSGENPTSARIPACNSAYIGLGIATCEKPALFCGAKRFTLSFQNAQSVPILASRPLPKGLLSVMAE